MLEDWAWRHIANSEAYLKLFSLGWVALGGILSALFHRGVAVLNRAPYFALNSCIVLGIAAYQSVWLLGGQAMQGGWLFWVIAADAVLGLAAGYALVALGQARSRDAFGHGKAGIASLIPLANLWLLFSPPQDSARAGPSIALLRGGLGVVVGLALIVLSRVYLVWVGPKIEENVIAVGEDPALMDRFVTLRLTQTSLPQVLRDVVAETKVPEDLGDGVSLQEVKAEGAVLTFVYALAEPGAELVYGAADELRKGVCGDPYFVRILSEGAKVEFRYVGVDGLGAKTELGTIAVVERDCGV